VSFEDENNQTGKIISGLFDANFPTSFVAEFSTAHRERTLWRRAAPSHKNSAPELNRIGVFMRILGFVAGVLLAAVACGSAFADCRDDLVKADQHFNRTRSDLQKAAT